MTTTKPDITVISPGAVVVLLEPTGQSPMAAVVIGVLIRSAGSVEYEVTWWDGRTRCEAWVKSVEVAYNPDSKKPLLPIGFFAVETDREVKHEMEKH